MPNGTTSKKPLSAVLKERGYVYQSSLAALPKITDDVSRTVYLGLDPTADSLHVGHLMTLLMLKHFLNAGHKAVVVIGGGTGLIGDPSGKKTERQLQEQQTIRDNAAKIKKLAAALLDSKNLTIVNNYDWLGKLNVISFLRDVGKHFTVNELIAREYVKERITQGQEGISFTEFSYALLQAYDFLHLHEAYGCDVQIGGSDQWGNMVSGIELIRKCTGKEVYALTHELMVDPLTGEKFGKTSAGTVWLSASKTSVYNFYQFWLNVADAQAISLLKSHTLLPMEKVNDVALLFARNPELRLAQKTLAFEVTALVHGVQAATAAKNVSEILFGDEPLESLSADEQHLLLTAAPKATVNKAEIAAGIEAVDFLVRAKLVLSKSEARRVILSKGVTVNNVLIDSVERKIGKDDVRKNIILLKKGKKIFSVVEVV